MLDVSASYPNGEVTFNISKETTSKEIVRVEGVSEEDFRAQNMLVQSGHVDAVEYCTKMLNFQRLPNLRTHFNEHMKSKGKQHE